MGILSIRRSRNHPPDSAHPAIAGSDLRIRPAKSRGIKERKAAKRWSKHVTETSSALDLEESVFKKDDPREIAKSLKRSAERSTRRKAQPFASAMSMLNFYVNRAGKKLSSEQKERLDAAKDELRELYHRPRRGSTNVS
jgi:hypothetical protein